MNIELICPEELEAQKAENLPAFSGIKILHVKRSIAELLGHIGGNGIFDQYTKHDISHIDSMLSSLEWIIPKESRDKLTSSDWLMIVLSIYFHDLAMLVTKEEFKNRHKSDFISFCEQELFNGKQGIDYQEKIDKLPGEEKDRFLYQEFVRKKHAERIRYWIVGQAETSLGVSLDVVKEIDNLLKNLDPVFRRDLGLVCESHHLDDLGDFSKYKTSRPYGQSKQETVNLQYCAVVLRTADLLHITRDRTPSLAFRILNPADPVSQQEWAKQMAVRSVRTQLGLDKNGNYSDSAPKDTIEVHANFKAPEGFFGLTLYLSYCQSQLRKNYEWIESSRRLQGIQLSFPWRHIDRSHIETEGFLSKTFEFTIEQANILDLLTGHTLYNDASVVLRELVQNAVDAVRLQCKISGLNSAEEGRIAISWNSAERVLTISDNGTGMSQLIIENHLLKVGSSRYQDPDFKKKHPDFCPISRFGIGILSAFMVADSVEIITVHPDDDEARQLSLKSVHGSYLISLLNKQDDPRVKGLGKHGTCIKLHVRASAKFEDPLKVAEKWVVIPNCKVSFSNDGGKSMPVGFRNEADALEALLESEGYKVIKDGARPKHADVAIRKLVDVDSGITLAVATEWSDYFQEWKFLQREREMLQYEYADEEETEDRNFGECTCVEGIRVKSGSPGFEGPAIYAIANAVGPNAPRTNVARSALEETPELGKMEEALYRLYCTHVKDEMIAQQSKRGLSVTWAVQEAGFLLGGIFEVPRSALTNRVAASRAAADVVPILLVEEGLERRAISLTDFRKYRSFWTVHGHLFQSAENLLRETPGANSLRSLISALANDNLALPDGPVLCGDSNLNPILELAFEGKEPTRFNFNYSQRRLDILWEDISSPNRWVRMPAVQQLVGTKDSRRLMYSNGTFSSRKSFFYNTWVCEGNIQTNGLQEEEIVKVGDKRFILPNSKLAELLLQFNKALTSGVNEVQKKCLFDFVIQFEESMNTQDGSRNMKRFYEDEVENIEKMIPVKLCLDALKTTKGSVFDTDAWNRNSEEED